ncbi:unnamed protein product [Adineta steineri]|uniref:EGF-like domain-containing protein n=1 Tax=Adineta steineri TaxID=433720 RepID=A0A815JM74_9BILA|nr:unnamed protein product [Adineta steineri]
MILQILSLSFIFIITVDIIHAISITKQGNDVFQLLKDVKERVKHGTQCLPPSKYFAGSCYTYMKLLPAKSWDEAYNNCLSLPLTKDARLLVIDSVAEYDFVERELIGPKSGSDSVSVYVGLRKINDTWLWSNDLPLKETPVYRFWIDTNKDILAYDCGALWLSKNSSILTAAACAEQSSRPYVCKYTVDRCYNNSGGCGKYGTCLNLPLLNSHKCNCRFLYAGERCEKWSDQGVQAIIGGIIVIAALIISFIISMDRSSNQWSFKKDAAEHYQAAAIYGQSRPTSYMPRSPHVIDRVISNPCSPQHEFFQASTPNEKHHRFSSSSTPPPIPPPIGRSIERKHRYSFRLSIQELEVTSHIRNLFIKPKRIIFIILPIVLTIIISIIILHARHYIKEKVFHESFNNSTRLFQFCALYDNNYYVNLVTLPIAVAIILLIIFNESRITSCRLKKEKSSEKFSIYTPIPFNPFSKVNRFDTMILCGIVSHEILQIIEEIFLKATQMKLLTMRGPLYDLILEYRYVRHLLQKTRRILFETNEKISFIKSLLYKIYRPNKYFHYSKQILNMYIIAFMLTYYLTFNILQAGFYIIEKLYSIFAIPLLVLTDELDLPHPQAFNLKYEMIIACFLTAIVYYGQLLWGMKSYQKHMIDSYKGIFIDIPPRTAFKSAQLISKHAHYPGYCLAYLGFAYISLGNIVFITIIILRVLFKQIFLVEQVAKVLIPILVLYLLKFILMWFLSRTFFLQKHGKTMALKNLRAFFIFNYFNFFFDCFLGIVSCSLRVTKASIAAVLFLPRLDYCIFGRTLEKMDSGFISYVSFIHMECLHTHPVLVYYCSLVCEKIERREQYLRSSKREMRNIEMEAYKRRQRAIFRWWLGYTLIRNTQLTQLRKHQVGHLQLQSAESFNEFLERKFFNRFQLPQTTKFTLTRSRRDLHAEGTMDSNTIIRNNTTACTTLLLDVDEHDDRKPGF